MSYSEKELRKLMEDVPLPEGEVRQYQKCRACGQISVREFIPYGLGHGRSFNSCMCRLTGNDRRGYEIISKEP